MNENASTKTDSSYEVFARKYRPTTFADLIGQDVLVRTLTNSINSKRLAQAYILTGVRGVGKTSTARIVARALNCSGAKGDGGPTPKPCGICENCIAISEDRHVDVIEMDAASRTGVDDIREVIDGVRYRPTVSRFKIYIIDEVHMLSRHAFNALLKTLEEPPEHVKFIFATTEIRKVPVTVLSRCQRFDLKRVEIQTLKSHFAFIANAEGARFSDGALHLIARASEGSVRDGLSLLDQVISNSNLGAKEIVDDDVRSLLGLADRSRGFSLLEATMRGDVSSALEILSKLYSEGSDPLAILEDLLDITHWLTRIKVVPSTIQSLEVPEMERSKGAELESQLTMATLARFWQMLLKGLNEVREAPSQIQAAEMIIVRLAYTAELPTPEEAIRKIDEYSNHNVTEVLNKDSQEASSSGQNEELPARSLISPEERGKNSPVAQVDANNGSNSAVNASQSDATSQDFNISNPVPRQSDVIDQKGVAKHPLVRAVLKTFPGSTIEEVRTVSSVPPQLETDTDTTLD
ncbi:MAG: DNA polymerase III subunit gamma/tau [Pseudomonadota bacterium]|nr:DNA polymerase III subunit gamma/tau [Pseudomonadota bacterium]